MDKTIDFEGLGRELLSSAHSHLSSWFPGGKLKGKEFVCGSIRGEEGSSLSVNISTGKWADFATGEKGGDLISLFASIHGIRQGEAAKKLLEQSGHHQEPVRTVSAQAKASTIGKPPQAAPKPSFWHFNFKDPIAVWCYVDSSNEPLFYVARYQDAEGKKQFIPWTWDLNKRGWVNKGFPEPRPLYNLAELRVHAGRSVLIVEGEKAVDAAISFAGGKYVVTTWPNGASSHAKTDWSVLRNRNVLIWPDADKAGIKAAHEIADRLYTICKQVKVLDVATIASQNGYDAFDFLVENPEDTWEKFREWAGPIAKLYEPKEAELAVPEQPPIEAYNEDVEPPFTGAVQINNQFNQFNLKKKSREPMVPGSVFAMWESLGLNLQNGKPVVNLSNAFLVLRNHPAFRGAAWYDEFHEAIFLQVDGETIKIKDEYVRDIAMLFQSELGLHRFEPKLVNDALKTYAHKNRRNEPKDWMESLTWDGKPRLDSFCTDYFGCDDTAYARAVSKNWWLTIVARIYRPGSKVDNMLILEGGQGVMKSSVFEIVGGAWYTSAGSEISDKQFIVDIQGKMIVELAELDNFLRSDPATVKRVLSTAVDRHCFKWEVYAKDLPRKCVFVGTTNDDTYLKDPTGARRFWPIEVKIEEVDKQKLTENRDQLFAEAVARFKKGETWWELPIDEALEQQEMRREKDVWEDEIRTFLIGKMDATTKEISKHLGIELRHVDTKTERRIGRCMRTLGWRSMTIRKHGYILRAYVPKVQEWDVQRGIPYNE
jgi:putative DNA primase/helicase